MAALMALFYFIVLGSIIVFIIDYVMAPLDIIASIFSKGLVTRAFGFIGAYRLLKYFLWLLSLWYIGHLIFEVIPDGHWLGVVGIVGFFIILFKPSLFEKPVFYFLNIFYSLEEIKKGVYLMSIAGSEKIKDRHEKIIQNMSSKV
jgi:hypothetical protein